MADYRQFEQNYPTLNKFVGAAREAASMMPGASYLTPGGQQYQDARTRFQQHDPNAALAGKALGVGVDMAAGAGLGGMALGGLGRMAAQQGVRQAMQSAAGSGSNFAPQLAQAIASRAPSFVAPTPANVATGARQVGSLMGEMPGLATAAAGATGLGIGAAGAMLPNRGPSMREQQNAAAKPLMDQEKQVWAARPGDNPAEHLARMRLINFMNARQGAQPQNINPNPMPDASRFAAGKDMSPYAQMTDTLAGAQMQQHKQEAARRQSGLALKMGPMDDPTLPFSLRERIQAATQKPHYYSAKDLAGNELRTAARADFDAARADPNATQQTLYSAAEKYKQWLAAVAASNNAFSTNVAYTQPGQVPTDEVP